MGGGGRVDRLVGLSTGISVAVTELITLQRIMEDNFLDGNCARCTTEFDGCGQYLWVCPLGVANPKSWSL